MLIPETYPSSLLLQCRHSVFAPPHVVGPFRSFVSAMPIAAIFRRAPSGSEDRGTYKSRTFCRARRRVCAGTPRPEEAALGSFCYVSLDKRAPNGSLHCYHARVSRQAVWVFMVVWTTPKWIVLSQ